MRVLGGVHVSLLNLPFKIPMRVVGELHVQIMTVLQYNKRVRFQNNHLLLIILETLIIAQFI